MKARAFSSKVRGPSSKRGGTVRARFAENRITTGRVRVYGGPGSGHFGHAGRPGTRGGSASGGVPTKKTKERWADFTDIAAGKKKKGIAALERWHKGLSETEQEDFKNLIHERLSSPDNFDSVADWDKATAKEWGKGNVKRMERVLELIDRSWEKGDIAKARKKEKETGSYSERSKVGTRFNPRIPAGDNYHCSVGWY